MADTTKTGAPEHDDLVVVTDPIAAADAGESVLSTKGAGRRDAYRASGVDVDAGEQAVALMRAAVAATHDPNVLSIRGGFGGAVLLPGSGGTGEAGSPTDRILISSTDGVGTKTAIAGAMGRFDTIGLDLVAMCADDVICTGAAPLFFLDYIAVGRLVPEDVAALVRSVAEGCRTAGCALVGGETAEHPGLMPADAFDLAGFCVGTVERGNVIDGSNVRPGDVVIGLESSGLHANGFSLVRSLIEQHDLDLSTPYQLVLRRFIGDSGRDEAMRAEPGFELATLGEILLTPTRIYARAILDLRDALRAGGHDLLAVSHITGGGLPGNVPRVLPAALGARVDPTRWRMPSVMRLVGAMGGVEDDEIRATLNGGLGMVVVVRPAAVEATLANLAAASFPAGVVGEIATVEELGGRRYFEEPLRTIAR